MTLQLNEQEQQLLKNVLHALYKTFRREPGMNIGSCQCSNVYPDDLKMLIDLHDRLADGTKQPEKVWIVKQESNDDGEMHFFTQPCKDEATAKSVLREWKEALLTKHPKYCDAKPYIDGEKDPDDQACCYEWENEDEDSFYIKVLGDDYYELITIEEKEIN